MSWVFLAGALAYKLKKPVHDAYVDLRTPTLRRRNCEAEVRLNRRLAPDVYLGISAVTREADGSLALDGHGEPIDWLVRMRRLPSRDMLDAVIADGRVTAEADRIRAVAAHLARFYLAATPVPLSADAYRRRLDEGTRQDVREIARHGRRVPRDRVDGLARGQLDLLERRPSLFDHRAAAGRIVEGHGDLRPEHICLGGEPAIIDCLEFDRDLRLSDPVDELAFLGLECERLGDARPGAWFLETYRELTGDDPPAPLLHFHRVFRALRRTTIALWHLGDPAVPDPERFVARAVRYLELVDPVAAAAPRPPPA